MLNIIILPMKKFVFLASLLMLMGFSGITKAQNGIFLIKSPTCFGASDGQLEARADFGTPPYTHHWNTGATTNYLTGIPAGIYADTVLDALSVKVVFEYTLNQPSAITTTPAIIVNNSNWPNPNGSITINATGGTGAFTYTLTDSLSEKTTTQASNIFTTLYSGTYYLRITDVNGCEIFDTLNVGENANLGRNLDLDYTACYNAAAGSSVQPSLTGVVPIVIRLNNVVVETVTAIIPGPEPYVLSDGSTASSISLDAYPGKNIVMVSDNSGQGFRYSWNVTGATAPINIFVTEKRDNRCFNGSEGSIEFRANGGWGDYDYTIDGPGGFNVNNNSANNLPAGMYTLSVSDSAGCSFSIRDSIAMPVEPLKINFSTRSTFCEVSPDGSARVDYIIGATYPVTYTWNTGATTVEIDSLWEGTYTVNVIDAYNCTASASIDVVIGSGICVPNYISPDGDGFNDYLNISHLCAGYNVNVETKIFDKQGLLLFESTNCDVLWDGTHKGGKRLPYGSEAYAVIKVTKPNGQFKIFRETITIKK